MTGRARTSSRALPSWGSMRAKAGRYRSSCGHAAGNAAWGYVGMSDGRQTTQGATRRARALAYAPSLGAHQAWGAEDGDLMSRIFLCNIHAARKGTQR